jgi:ribonuclease P protein component
MPAPVSLHRLTGRSEFLRVRAGLRASRPNVLVEARRRAPAGAIGIGFTASKRVGGAVERNRARRRLREAARSLLPEFGVSGVDYVFVARPQTPYAPWPSLLDDLRNALIRLRADLETGQEKPRSRGRRQRSKSTESD